MFNPIKYNMLEIVALLLFVITMTGCATTMRVVEKSLAENDFVPEEAVSSFDFLNEYDHHLPKPQNQLLDVDIAFERENVLISGDNIYTQIALTSKAPPRKANNIHLLVYNSAETQSEELTAMQHAVQAIASGKIPDDSTLTVDWYAPNSKIPAASLLEKNYQSNDLVSFLRQFVRLKLDRKPHHFVLLIGGHSDLNHEQKQNLVDIAHIFQVQSSTLSVLSVANKPEVAFLNQLSNKGNGLFNIASSDFNYEKWIDDEVHYVSAGKISDIKVTISTDNLVEIREIKSPAGMVTSPTILHHNVSDLIQGDQYAMILELRIPILRSAPKDNTINVNVEYFDITTNQYSTITKSAKLTFVNSKNETLGKKDPRVSRSLLILNTQDVLKDIVPVIREHRYYRAVAMLTEQRIKLERFASIKKDEELLRDVQILDRYSDKLYNFDETVFQTLKTWNDFSWDTERYTESFN